ncbi:hypothetical protein [Aliihoeflea sp. 40Bstr573]|uniref:hypothetical protein n=1 Tax=Aliihoeflea sp. 40Bstr573 TaxID=2696467 RepID=UPI0020949636|nr:hypothetical protein [Aliihoeflea sp. 40Bstr573]MCO6389354.1 hypothetical protein [Aliihoeflea sp. 40Bstr573]
MPRLSLAVDIADTVDGARFNAKQMNIGETAAALLARHPEADASLRDVVDVLQDEAQAKPRDDKRV